MNKLDEMASRVWFRIKVQLWVGSVRRTRFKELLMKIVWS